MGIAILGIYHPGGAVLAAQPERSFLDLQVRLQVQQPSVLQLEPINLRVSISNPTSRPLLGIRLTFCFECRGNALEIYVVAPNGQRKRYPELWGRRVMVIPRGHPQVLEPGQSTTGSVTLHLMLDEMFPDPGTYQVIAVLHELDGAGVLESAPVALQVREPEGLNSLVFMAIREFEEKGIEYFWGGGCNLATSQEFVLRHGDTRYGAYVAHWLGKHFLSRRDYDKAIEYLSIASQRPDFFEGEL